MSPRPRNLAAALLAVLGPSAFAAEPPSEVRVASPWHSAASMELTWQDNSDDEDGFEIEVYAEADGMPIFTTTSRKSQTLFQFTGGGVGVEFFFRLRTKSSASGDSEWTDLVPLLTPPNADIWMRPSAAHSGMVGQPIAPFTPAVFGNPPTEFSATDLPEGLSIDTTSGEITGTAMEEGFFRTIVTTTDGTSTVSTFVTFRFIHAPTTPEVAAEIPDQMLENAASPVAIDLNNHFADPDISSVTRFATNRGNLDVILYPKTTPASVENFLSYINRDHYTDMLVHRSARRNPNGSGVDVIQGGSFIRVGANELTAPERDAGVVNEPGIPNNRGTLAYAKPSNIFGRVLADEGTAGFYVNTLPNNGLDADFATFGRLSVPSETVMDDIWMLPVGSYDYSVDGDAPKMFDELPLNQTPAGAQPELEDLVRFLSAVEIDQFLTFEVSSNSAPAIVSATITDQLLELSSADPVAVGEANVEVTATDLDGFTVSDTFTVAIPGSNYDTWSQEQTFPGDLSAPGDDGESDSLKNLLEYGLLGDPSQSDAGGVLPSLSTQTVDDDEHLALTFTHLKLARDLIYKVEKSEDLSNWVTIWQTSDGLDHPNVAESADDTTHWTLTIVDPVPIGAPAPGQTHLRLQVELLQAAAP